MQWRGGSIRCRYDPVGRRYRECGDNSPGWASFDGDNVIRLEGGYAYPTWRFVHGPGLDDPLVGLRNVNGVYEKFYYLTDGRGRQLAFTDSVGNDRQSELVYTQNGGNQAGGITASHGFENERGESPEAPDLSFYRNRYYDQRTGRFTQEDPIGIAGGANLYGYASNNPAAQTDPFGLCPKPPCRSPDDPLKHRPLPEGVNENEVTWDPNFGKHGAYRHNKTGTIYRPHPEDAAHWDHWDVIQPGTATQKHEQDRWPVRSLKPGHGFPGTRSDSDPWSQKSWLERAWQGLKQWATAPPTPFVPEALPGFGLPPMLPSAPGLGTPWMPAPMPGFVPARIPVFVF